MYWHLPGKRLCNRCGKLKDKSEFKNRVGDEVKIETTPVAGGLFESRSPQAGGSSSWDLEGPRAGCSRDSASVQAERKKKPGKARPFFPFGSPHSAAPQGLRLAAVSHWG
jgi:hypothetical protein